MHCRLTPIAVGRTERLTAHWRGRGRNSKSWPRGTPPDLVSSRLGPNHTSEEVSFPPRCCPKLFDLPRAVPIRRCVAGWNVRPGGAVTTDAISAKSIPSTPRWSARAGESGAKPTPTIRRTTGETIPSLELVFRPADAPSPGSARSSQFRRPLQPAPVTIKAHLAMKDLHR